MRLGTTEIILIIVLALVLFGGSKLSGVGKALGTRTSRRPSRRTNRLRRPKKKSRMTSRAEAYPQKRNGGKS